MVIIITLHYFNTLLTEISALCAVNKYNLTTAVAYQKCNHWRHISIKLVTQKVTINVQMLKFFDEQSLLFHHSVTTQDWQLTIRP